MKRVAVLRHHRCAPVLCRAGAKRRPGKSKFWTASECVAAKLVPVQRQQYDIELANGQFLLHRRLDRTRNMVTSESPKPDSRRGSGHS